MVAAAPAAMAAVDPDQAALAALVRARLAEEAGNPAEALAALQSLASQAPDLPGLRAEMLERAIDAGDLIAARSAAAALWASGDQRFDARLVLVVDAMRRSDWCCRTSGTSRSARARESAPAPAETISV